jgi:steroid delta-isomerase-like uncharacterized protein
MTTDHTQLVRRLYDDYLNANHLDRLDEVIGPDYAPPQGGRGPQAFGQAMQALRTGFPDIAYQVDHIVAQGDRVAVRWTWRGTHTGPFRSFAPTGKRVENSGTAFFEIRDGKIASGQIDTDRLGFLQGIGAIPYDPAFGPPPR